MAEFDKYEITQSLLKNDFNEILIAKRPEDEKQVILKRSILSDESIPDVSKSGHEYNILKELDHQGIPKVYDFIFDGNNMVLVREFVEGKDLRRLLLSSKLKISEILNISLQLLDILDHVHKQGIIHKDINPGNIILQPNGKIKLIDFAISSNVSNETSELLNVDEIEGSLIYISPEQTGRTAYDITPASDFYSFGILLYELLVGKPPFDSADPLEVVHFHLSKKPIPVSSISQDVPDGLEEVVSKLLKKNPDERYKSATGIKHDLLTIKHHYETQKHLHGFKAGSKDLAGTYKQNQKLYGREEEIKALLGAYKKLGKNNTMLVLIAGYSGIGKSALIRHVKYPIIQENGIFIIGKFDQFKKDIPYFAFIEAIQEYLKKLLTESEQEISSWKNRILRVLGENAGLITEVIPLLSKIIGQQPSVARLQPAEQEARFNFVLLDFIFAVSTPEHPLVIFLDDLQWADLSSLNLMKRIIESKREDNNILILGAYRDNEVDKGHPLLITLKQIDPNSEQVKHIRLKPLDEETTVKITADSFAMDMNQARELGVKVFDKTKGNPFFIHSFLKSLFDKKLIIKDKADSWSWNAKKIDALDYTDNVVELMTEGLIMLSLQTQEMLKRAAVLGNTFNLIDLAELTGQSQTDVYRALLPAIHEGFVHSIDKKYRLLAISQMSDNENFKELLSDRAASFTFSHDKVQQAAYNLVPPDELSGLHRAIGKLLIQNRTQAEINENIFEVLNHFSKSLDLIKDPGEKENIVGLCLIAGRKAKESNSYQLGVRYLSMGEELLGRNPWMDNYQLTYNILIELGECEYLNHNPKKAEKYFKEILQYSQTNYEKLKVYYLHSSLYLKMGNTQESLRLGLEAAKLYEIRFPTNKWLIQFATLFAMLKYLLLFSTKFRNTDKLYNQKDCTDEERIALHKFLIDLSTSAYQQDQNLMMLAIFKIVKLYIKDGFTDASGFGFSGFSVVVLSALKMQKRGFSLWEITKRMHKKTQSPVIKWRLSYTVHAFENHRSKPFADSYEDILEMIKACRMNGDQIFTAYSVALQLRVKFMAGMSLPALIQNSDEHIPTIENSQVGLDFMKSYYQLVKVLVSTEEKENWDDDSYNGAETLARLEREGNRTKLALFHTPKSVVHYFLGQHSESLLESEKAASYSDNILGDIDQATHAFFTALNIAVVYESLDKKEQKKWLKVFKGHLKTMKLYAEGCAENFEAHYNLLLAEQLAITNSFNKAIRFYEKAIKSSSENQIVYVKAIACERAAEVCERVDLPKHQNMYIEDAWQAYTEWGATIKVKQLERKYTSIFSKLQSDTNQFIPSESTGSSISALNLASVLKASQSIASVVKYEELLNRLMHITMENAGAERGCLVLLKKGKLCLEVVKEAHADKLALYDFMPISDTDQVPESMVNYCWRTEESVVVNNGHEDDYYKKDPFFISNKTRSAICMPIRSQGKMSGVLYLENNLLGGVFNKNRIRLLQLLSGQIGISIDNAQMYENLENKVIERTQKIEEQRIQIQQEKEKSDELLLNILPKHTAEELKTTGYYRAKSYDNVTVMFCDIVGFTTLGENLDANSLVNELHEFISGIDDIVAKYGIEKIKTIGDAYLCAAGLDNDDGVAAAVNSVYAANEIIDFLAELNRKKNLENRIPFNLRIGIHSGPVTAGVVGKSKYVYDIWGDTVNTAARMESSGEEGKINISGELYKQVRKVFECQYRGKVSAKNKGEIDMYFIRQTAKVKVENS